MSIAGSFSGDLAVNGTVICTGFNGPAGFLTDAMIQAGAGVQATKLIHQYTKQYCQESATTVVSEARVVHIVYGNVGGMSQNANASTVVDFRAGCVVACLTTATITVDLLKNGASILSAPISLDHTVAAYAKVAGVVSNTVLANGDVLEVKIVATAGGGTLGKGVFAEVTMRENPL